MYKIKKIVLASGDYYENAVFNGERARFDDKLISGFIAWIQVMHGNTTLWLNKESIYAVELYDESEMEKTANSRQS